MFPPTFARYLRSASEIVKRLRIRLALQCFFVRQVKRFFILPSFDERIQNSFFALFRNLVNR